MEGTYRIGQATVVVGHDSVRTCYDDGAEVYACPAGTEEQDAIATALGYGTGPEALAAMTRDHDTLHTLLAVTRGWPISPTLDGVAHHCPTDPKVANEEERLVMLVQRLLNVGLAEVLSRDFTPTPERLDA